MGYIPLEIIVKSAKVFKNVNFFTKMHLYTTVSLIGDDSSTSKKKKTTVDEHSGSHPFWWFPIKFEVDESKLLKNNLMLLFQVRCSRNFGDKSIGILTLPVKDLYDSRGNQKFPTNVAYTINSRTSGRPRGVLYLSYMFSCDNETKCIIDERPKNSRTSNNNTLLSAPVPLPCPSPAPSAPYIGTEDDDQYFFATSPIGSSPSFPADSYGFRPTTPSAPYLPVEHGIF